jgi:hypothetical protein
MPVSKPPFWRWLHGRAILDRIGAAPHHLVAGLKGTEHLA